MSHEFDRGIMTTSSWHGLEEVGAMPTAEAMIAHAERTGSWPTAVRYEDTITSSGLSTGARAVVGSYLEHADRVIGLVGDRYHATDPAQWREMMLAAGAAGAQPTGAFSLRDGRTVLGTFEVEHVNGIRTNLMLADSFDGDMRLSVGFTSVRVVCANTLAAAFQSDHATMKRLTHTASLEERAKVLADAIPEAVKSGASVREQYEQAERTYVDATTAKLAFDMLFPEAREGASKGAATKAENAREAARLAAKLDVNHVGVWPGNLGTLWNAATYLVDRTEAGEARGIRGRKGQDGMLESMLLGSRAKRIAEIQHVIEVIMRDGTVEYMTAPQAVEAGVDVQTVGAKVLEEMLADG